MLSSISRLSGLLATTLCLGTTASARADVPLPIMPTPVAPVAPLAPLPVPPLPVPLPAPGPHKVLLHVCHPCSGCHYDVPVCLPACCQGAPCVSHHRTIIGCGRVVYQWSCGYRVVIRFPRGGGYRVVQG